MKNFWKNFFILVFIVCPTRSFAGEVTADNLYKAMNTSDIQEEMAQSQGAGQEGVVVIAAGSYVPATFWHLFELAKKVDPRSKDPYAILGQAFERFRKDKRVIGNNQLSEEEQIMIFVDILLANRQVKDFMRHVAIYQDEFFRKIRDNVPYSDDVGRYVWGQGLGQGFQFF